LSDQILEWLALYGLPAYFLILVISSAGIPFPITLMLVVTGSFVQQGEMVLWQVLLLGTAGAVIGDQIGYGIGRWGGRRLVNRITKRFGGADNIERAENFSRKWGASGIFFSRWLITPLGPWVNMTSGAADYPWPRFIIWDILGEIIWVGLFVSIGRLFSDRVQQVADLLGNLTWVIFGLFVAAILAWNLIQFFRSPDDEEKKQ
jgi:membrane-associated protein